MFLVTALLCLLVGWTSAAATREFSIDLERDCYSKDGECYRYISGEMHYFRIPPEYWEDRLLKLRAAGFDTVQTYIPWNVHEPKEDDYRFSGPADVYRYILMAQQLGLNVIVRPGPFLATEWDFGGFPGWLLKDRPTIEFRRNETIFMSEVGKWYDKLLPTLVPLLYRNGGPIIAVQVENEFGSNKPCDAAHFAYLTTLRDIYYHHLGRETVLLTVDGDSHRLAKCGNIDGLYSTVNFGAGGKVAKKFAVQRKQEPHGPYVCSAFFSGWLDHWGHQFNKVSTEVLVESLKDVLEFANRSASVSMYMFHGGTNFEYTQGGKGDWNNDTTDAYPMLWPKLTSYDYDAPLSEAGDTTWKYQKIRELLSNYSKVYEVPANTTKGASGNLKLGKGLSLLMLAQFMEGWDVIRTAYPQPMEQMSQNHGLVLYQTKLRQIPAEINVPLFGDRIYAMTLLTGVFWQSSRNRVPQTFTVTNKEAQGDYDLFLLVEDNGHSNSGHVRYPASLYQKGIVGNVTVNGQVQRGWTAYLISNALAFKPSELLDRVRNAMEEEQWEEDQAPTPYFHPRVYQTKKANITQDTFIRLDGWGKGYLFVGKHLLGRYWPLAGPQLTHFCPGSWFDEKYGITLVELERAPLNKTITLTDTPQLDGPYDPDQL